MTSRRAKSLSSCNLLKQGPISLDAGTLHVLELFHFPRHRRCSIHVLLSSAVSMNKPPRQRHPWSCMAAAYICHFVVCSSMWDHIQIPCGMGMDNDHWRRSLLSQSAYLVVFLRLRLRYRLFIFVLPLLLFWLTLDSGLPNFKPLLLPFVSLPVTSSDLSFLL